MKKITVRQDLVITKIVAGYFALMLKRENQGWNFSWESFPESCADLVDANIFLYFKSGYKFDMPSIREHARSYAEDLVKRANLLEKA